MSTKRAAETQITQDSLERDEKPEDAGHFERAPELELKGRVLKKARRTLPATVSTDPSTSSGGGLFSGIRLTSLLTQQNGHPQPKPPLLFCDSSSSNPLTQTSSLPPNRPASVAKPTFLSELRNLNTSVNDWIGKHVRENPYVDLTPIFRDYEQHLRGLDHKFQSEKSSVGQRKEVESEVATSSDTSDTDVKSSQSCSGVTESKMEGVEGEDGTDEENNKPQETPAADEEEAAALLSVRAKLFFKKSSDDEFTELGIGQLRVLPGNTDGVRVVMRNETTLAKVLLNVRITDAIPVTCKNNNILLVCVPNPPLEKAVDDKETPSPSPQAVTYLIRVKTVTMATSLLQALPHSQ